MGPLFFPPAPGCGAAGELALALQPGDELFRAFEVLGVDLAARVDPGEARRAQRLSPDDGQALLQGFGLREAWARGELARAALPDLGLVFFAVLAIGAARGGQVAGAAFRWRERSATAFSGVDTAWHGLRVAGTGR